MNKTTESDATAVDDVRRVREKIADEHAGNVRKHIEETNRATAELCKKLGIKSAPTPQRDLKSGT